jgi:hypothetical protein
MSEHPTSDGSVLKWECRDGDPEEDHNWERIRDWAGDPGVIGGTYDIRTKRCRQCGKEIEDTDPDDDYDDEF